MRPYRCTHYINMARCGHLYFGCLTGATYWLYIWRDYTYWLYGVIRWVITWITVPDCTRPVAYFQRKFPYHLVEHNLRLSRTREHANTTAIVREPHVVQFQNFNTAQYKKPGTAQSTGHVAYATSVLWLIRPRCPACYSFPLLPLVLYGALVFSASDSV